MNILYPIGSFYPAQLGGPANTIYWLAKALHERGHSIYVGTTDYGIKNEHIKLNEWLDTDCGRVLYQKTQIIYFPFRLIFRLLPVLKHVEIVHMTSLFYPLSWLLSFWLVISGCKKKIIWSVRGELTESALEFSSFKKKIILAWVRIIFGHRVVFHTTSDQESMSLKRVFGNHVRFVQLPNYIYLPQKLNRDPEKIVLFLGRIHPIKGIENLITAFAGIKDHPDFKLVIAGNDENKYANDLKTLCYKLGITSRVEFAGHLDNGHKERLLSSAYLLVLPSHSENFGNVVIEALAQGTPVIASRNTPWEILEQIQPGTWVTNDSASIRQAIENILNLKNEIYMDIRESSYQLCKNHFSISDNIEKWEEAYEKVLRA